MGRNSGHVLLPFVIVLLYLAAFRGRILPAIFSNPVITDIGGMCYSIYLFHFLIIYGVKHLTAPLHFGGNFWAYYAVQSCLILPVVMLFCGAFFLLIERPCMDREWPRKLWAASPSPHVAASPATSSLKSLAFPRMMKNGRRVSPTRCRVRHLKHKTDLKTWWPGTELKRRRQPFQTGVNQYLQRLNRS